MKHTGMFRAALVALLVAVWANNAMGTYWDWKGKSSDVCYFNDTTCWFRSDNKNTNFNESNHWIGYGAATIASGWDGVIVSRSLCSQAAALNVKYMPLVVFKAEKDNPQYGIDSAGTFSVAIEGRERGDGAVEFRSGIYKFTTVTAAYTSGRNGSIKITGATLEANAIAGGSGKGVLEIDGGVIRAKNDNPTFMPANANFTVVIGENGATIDNNGKAITIGEDLAGSGTTVLDGSGITSFGPGVEIEGALDVKSGTTLKFDGSKPSKVGTIALSAGSTLEIDVSAVVATPLHIDELCLPEEGTATLKVSGNVLSTAYCKVLDVGTIAGETSNLEILFEATAGDGKSIEYYSENGSVFFEVFAEDENVWNGRGDGTSFSDPNNWSRDKVPPSGAKLLFNAVAVNGVLNCDIENFSASAITFMAGAPSFKIEGGDISGVSVVSNNSANVIEFGNKVFFAENVNVVQNPGVVKFIDGATGIKLSRKMNLHGTYNFTTTGNHNEIDGVVVESDGVYRLLDGVFNNHVGKFTVEQGGRVRLKVPSLSVKVRVPL